MCFTLRDSIYVEYISQLGYYSANWLVKKVRPSYKQYKGWCFYDTIVTDHDEIWIVVVDEMSL